MSLTVYEGYRLGAKVELDSYLHKVGARARQGVVAALRSRYEHLAAIIPDDDPELTVFLGEGRRAAKLRLAELRVRNQYRAQAGKCDLDNFDASLSFWYLGRRIYLVPHHNPLATPRLWKFLQEDDNLEDYSFWNNGERPEEVSYRVWKQRGKVWEKIFSRSWGWETRLQFLVFETSTYFLINPIQDMVRAESKP